jgi:hypothetical protein
MSGIPDQPRRRLAIVPEHGGSPELDGALTSVLDAINGLRVRTAESAAARRGDSVTAQAAAAVIGQASSILDELAAELAAIYDALDEQAHTASRYGVKIGTDGRPPPVLAGSPADAAAASERHWALAYRQAFEQAVADARQARRHAASQLTDLCATISGPVRELNDRSRAPLIGWPRTPWPRPRRG